MNKCFFSTLLGTFLIARLLIFADANDSQVNEEAYAKSKISDVHGFVDVAFKNDYITPRGLLVTNTGLTIQVLMGMSLDFYKNPNPEGLLNSLSLTFGIWNDLWTDQNNSFIGAWNECDWFIGFNTLLGKNWKFGVQYIQFVSPPYNFRPENNIEFVLAYDDSFWKLPVVLNPYVKLFWTVAGDSTVVVGRRGHTYDVEIGAVPTLTLKNLCVSLIITAPTWFTVGPASFWNGGDLGLKHKNCNFGVFSTGINIKFPLKFIRESLGDWYFDVGGQYYCLINDSLLQAQTLTLGVPSYHKAHRNVGVAMAGFGFGF